MIRSAHVFALCAAVFALGCDQLGLSPQKKEAKVSATACADYAKKVCTAAGEQSPTCITMKTATDLMPAAACGAALADFSFTEKKLGAAAKVCEDLTTKLCAEIGSETETCAMVRAQTKTFPAEKCAAIAEPKQYAATVAELKRREMKNQPLTPEKIAQIAKNDAPSFGPEGAAVTLVEFSDFQCPFCSRAANVVSKVKEKYGDKVRFVFRQFPLSFHQNAHVAAEASLAAHAQGKFWALHDKMFEDQSKLDRESLEASAKAVGVDVAKLKKALDDKTFAATVDADMKLGEEVGVDGTPTVFLNGKRIQDPSDFDAISKQIDAALSGGGAG